MGIGENVKKYRLMKSLTLPALATQAGVSKAFLWEIESGGAKRPGAEILYRIAEALGVTIAHLLGKHAEAADGEGLEPDVNPGLAKFIKERKRAGTPLDPEEIKSLSYVQLRGGRPRTKEQWALVYGLLKEMTDGE